MSEASKRFNEACRAARIDNEVMSWSFPPRPIDIKTEWYSLDEVKQMLNDNCTPGIGVHSTICDCKSSDVIVSQVDTGM